jgi:large subunit ribosomal protein L7/L12
MANIPDKSPDQLGATGQLRSILETLDTQDASELVKQIEEAFKVSDFDVLLVVSKATGVSKAIAVGRGEAKALVEAAPKPVKEGVSRAEAEAVKDQLEQAGAKVSILNYHEELYAKHNSRQVDDYTINRIDNIFVELARIDHRISQNQVDIDDLKTETRELLSTLRVSNL